VLTSASTYLQLTGLPTSLHGSGFGVAVRAFLTDVRDATQNPVIMVQYAMHLETLSLTSRVCDLALALSCVTVASNDGPGPGGPHHPAQQSHAAETPSPDLPRVELPMDAYIDRVTAMALLVAYVVTSYLLAETPLQRQVACQVVAQLLDAPHVLDALVQSSMSAQLRRAAAAGHEEAITALEYRLEAVVILGQLIRCARGGLRS
jgi:hypothetical protein